MEVELEARVWSVVGLPSKESILMCRNGDMWIVSSDVWIMMLKFDLFVLIVASSPMSLNYLYWDSQLW